jgi:hypothetical protein
MVRKKPYVERPEGNGTGNSVLAVDAFAKHKLREDSFVQDIFGSQMLSQLSCLHCGHVSVCFEFQHTVPLAIPRNHSRRIAVCFVPKFESLGLVLWPSKACQSSTTLVEGLTRLRAECMRPLLMNIEMDTLCPANKLVNEVMTMISRKSIVKDFGINGDSGDGSFTESAEDGIESICGSMYRTGSIILFQAKKAAASAKKTFSATPASHEPFVLEPTLQRPIANDEIIARLPTNCTFYAYSVPERKSSSQFNCFIYQVATTDLFVSWFTGYPLILFISSA